MGHVVESLNVPDAYKVNSFSNKIIITKSSHIFWQDWEVDDQDSESEEIPEKMRRRWISVLSETLVMILLQMLFNLILLLPIFLAGSLSDNILNLKLCFQHPK